jgi:hypothetical protein
MSQNPESEPHRPALWDLCGDLCKTANLPNSGRDPHIKGFTLAGHAAIANRCSDSNSLYGFVKYHYQNLLFEIWKKLLITHHFKNIS